MKKKLDQDEQEIHNKLVEVFKITNQKERLEIAARWCQDFTVNENWSKPEQIYFILAALIDVEHPVIIADKGMMYSYMGCIEIILRTELHQTALPVPYQIIENLSTAHCGLPVDK
jgi:hypothetical protein